MASNSSPSTAAQPDNTLSNIISTAAKALEISLNTKATKLTTLEAEINAHIDVMGTACIPAQSPLPSHPGLAKLANKIKYLAVANYALSEEKSRTETELKEKTEDIESTTWDLDIVKEEFEIAKQDLEIAKGELESVKGELKTVKTKMASYGLDLLRLGASEDGSAE